MALPDPQSASVDDDGRSRDRALIARIAAAERWARTADALMTAHMLRLARESAKVRRGSR